MVCFYAGYGTNKDGNTHAVCPDAATEAPIYNLDSKLKYLASMPGSYVLAMLSCNRLAFDRDNFK